MAQATALSLLGTIDYHAKISKASLNHPSFSLLPLHLDLALLSKPILA